MSESPVPLVPHDCDLRDFQFMAMDVRRLLTSETWMLGTGDQRAAAMSLWLESWHQVPAGSLPGNDQMLSHLAQCPQWKKAKAHALRGWQECSDGRLYHPVVAEKALEAWISKLTERLGAAEGNAKRWGGKFDPVPFQSAIGEAADRLRRINPHSKALTRKVLTKVFGSSPPDSPPDDGGPSKSSRPPSQTPNLPPSRGTMVAEIVRDRDRDSKGIETVSERAQAISPPDRPPIKVGSGRTDDSADNARWLRLVAKYPNGDYDEHAFMGAERDARRRVDDGFSWDELESGVDRLAAQVQAKGNVGTRYVWSPAKFFGPDPDAPGRFVFQREFKLPRTKAEAQQDANVAAAEQWLAKSGDAA